MADDERTYKYDKNFPDEIILAALPNGDLILVGKPGAVKTAALPAGARLARYGRLQIVGTVKVEIEPSDEVAAAIS